MSPGPNRNLTNKVALITGAASGIGTATAKRLTVLGVKVALADMIEAGVQQVAAAIRTDGGEALVPDG